MRYFYATHNWKCVVNMSFIKHIYIYVMNIHLAFSMIHCYFAQSHLKTVVSSHKLQTCLFFHFVSPCVVVFSRWGITYPIDRMAMLAGVCILLVGLASQTGWRVEVRQSSWSTVPLFFHFTFLFSFISPNCAFLVRI